MIMEVKFLLRPSEMTTEYVNLEMDIPTYGRTRLLTVDSLGGIRVKPIPRFIGIPVDHAGMPRVVGYKRIPQTQEEAQKLEEEADGIKALVEEKIASILEDFKREQQGGGKDGKEAQTDEGIILFPV